MKPPAPWRIRQLVEQVPVGDFDSTVTRQTVVVGWVVEQLTLYTFTPGSVEGEYVTVDYFPNGPAAIDAFAGYGSLAI
ncbi:hypothetical protein SEA_APOCALYPSE_65 [Mycobacterium phage Apocalypse]|uniref:Uncharacterized protein n=2 Tax=Anayavirus TaxID=2946797 RepID=A0A249XLS1_9CAUD|nr:hypothetical protein ANGELICA_62 [Mycobacterium phage Angelica]YP_009952659.1 hypothetical protein I5G93_gp39 [Mycobacterium phage Apocalypse]ADL71151.1 hypothetical protein ANGELICA_62 [Mycobacterium phage Angelica]ASZ72692.1 hypothetical protein SEA_APOCALYPSE_65 [Mycobacterium phage Apocalypse]